MFAFDFLSEYFGRWRDLRIILLSLAVLGDWVNSVFLLGTFFKKLGKLFFLVLYFTFTGQKTENRLLFLGIFCHRSALVF